EQNADTVAPWRPEGPFVVTTDTELATRRMARMKALRSIFILSLSAIGKWKAAVYGDFYVLKIKLFYVEYSKIPN
ncbi:MAG: hypothetical protein AAFW74_13040, partial [Pseudomonadota bacterium]